MYNTWSKVQRIKTYSPKYCGQVVSVSDHDRYHCDFSIIQIRLPFRRSFVALPTPTQHCLRHK